MTDGGNPQFPDEVPTPVGDSCVDCEEAIEEGQRGWLVPHLEPGGWVDRPHHVECLFRAVTGGIEHLTAPPGHAVGSCYEGSTLTYRESALAAWFLLESETRAEGGPS